MWEVVASTGEGSYERKYLLDILYLYLREVQIRNFEDEIFFIC
jgi:hypothetical protein